MRSITAVNLEARRHRHVGDSSSLVCFFPEAGFVDLYSVRYYFAALVSIQKGRASAHAAPRGQGDELFVQTKVGVGGDESVVLGAGCFLT